MSDDFRPGDTIEMPSATVLFVDGEERVTLTFGNGSSIYTAASLRAIGAKVIRRTPAVGEPVVRVGAIDPAVGELIAIHDGTAWVLFPNLATPSNIALAELRTAPGFRYPTQHQGAVIDGLRQGRRLRPIHRVRCRGDSGRVVLGFSEREPVDAHVLGGLVARGVVEIRDGEIVLREAGSEGGS